MAPGAKRKRPDRTYAQDEGRPSPHRPESLPMAQHGPRNDGRGYGRGDNRRRGGPSQTMDGSRRPFANQDTISSPSNSTPIVRSPVISQTAQPQSVTPAPVQQLRPPPLRSAPVRQPSPPLDDSEPLEYEIVTDDIVNSWTKGGREHLKEIVAETSGEIHVGLWMQELVRSAIRRRIDPKLAGEFFKEIHDLQHPETTGTPYEDIFVDTVALASPADWKRSATAQLVLASGIPTKTWRLALDTDCIEALGMSREKFTRQKTRLITNHLYRQSNYNLLREESEGYAKLITEYFNIAINASASDSPPTLALDAFERVKALVGSFDLDVGRVLDITLDVFANLLVRNFRFFVKFVRASSWWPELECPDIIKWSGQGFDPLPDWALPSSRGWGVGQEETDRLSRLRSLITARDVDFWKQVRERGLNAFSDIGAKWIANFDDKEVQELLSSELEAKDDDRDRNGVEKNKIKRLRLNDRRKWMLTTRKLPPLGNPDAANLLGFKLAFYTSPARDKTDVMPDNLIFLSALLIKIGFISLRDLYPHLYPPDEKMTEVKTRLEKEQEERELANRPGGGPNKLAMSGALPDDTMPAIPVVKNLRDNASSKGSSPKPESTPKPVDEEVEQLPEPPDQKIALLKALLVIGAIPEALFILGRFPWLADVVPDLPRHFHRIAHHMLTKVYEDARPLNDRDDLSMPASQISDPAGLPKGTLNLKSPAPRRPKRWPDMDVADQGDGTSFKFYWDDWNDNVPICQGVDDVFLMCSTILNFTGVKIGQDAFLLLKLARIGKKSLSDDRSHENETRWIDLLKRLLVPALSLTSRNPNVANEIFDLLRLFPTATRYSIYAEWHFGPTARLPDVKRAFDRTRLEARDVLKRISKTNIRSMGKALAKIAYGSPGIVLQTAINQMESYENLIEVFVECSRYFTFLGYDVLTWCLLNALGGNSRDRIQKDGMLTSSWLRALSTFAGAIYKRYNLCDPTPVLHYVASELRNGNSTDLELLEQMIVAMAGIKSDMAFNESQTLAMAGGELLQAQTLKQMADERHKNEKTSKRLIKCLTDSGLAGQSLISIAQERQMYTSREAASAAPLKVLGNNVDKIHQVFVQYLEAFRSNTTIEAFAAAVPDPIALMRDFGLDADVAFMIGRAGIAQEVARIDAQRKLDQQEKTRARLGTPALTNGDTAVVETDSTSVEVIMPDVKVDSDITPDDVMEDVDEALKEPAQISINEPNKTSDATTAASQTLHPALRSLVQAMPTILGEETSSTLSIPFYVTFWTLGLQDIVVNTSSYNQELAHQTSLANQIKNDRSDPSVSGAKERERKIKAINELKDKLGDEMKSQIGAYTQVRERLTREKDHWFVGFHNKVSMLATSLLQHCFIPRILLSPLDAHYTFTMIKFLHNNGTPEFRTMHLYDHLFKKNLLTNLIFGATAREAENLGRFLSEALKDLRVWHSDEKVFEKNAWGPKKQLPGFVRSIKDGIPDKFLEYQPFRSLLFKWHSSIKIALSACFDSEEYMHIRNAIIVLKALLPQFPVVNFMGNEMIKKVTYISGNDARGDLKLAALSLLGSLKPLAKDFLLVQQFHVPQFPHPADSQANTAHQSTPGSNNLNAQAPEFKPSPGTTSVGVGTSQPEAANEAEDGEINDDKKTTCGPKDDAIVVDSTPMPVAATPSVNLNPDKPIQETSRPGPGRQKLDVRDDVRAGSDTRAVQDRRGEQDPRFAGRPESRTSTRPDDRPSRNPRANANDNYGRLDRPSDLGQAPARPDAASQKREDGGRSPWSQSANGRYSSAADQRGPRDGRAAPTGPAIPSSRPPMQMDEVPQGPKAAVSQAPAPSVQSDGVNPARRALIEGSQPSVETPRAKRDIHPASHGSSPRHNDHVSQHPPISADRSRGTAPQPNAGDRRWEPALTGPRQDDFPRRPSSDLLQSRPPAQASSRGQDSSFGRLNAPDGPSGPRATPGDRRAAPSGPASGPRTGGSPSMPSQAFSQNRNGVRVDRARGSAPNTPARESAHELAVNVHPSRRAIVEPIDAGPARNGGGQSHGSSSAAPTGPSPLSRAPAAGPAPNGGRNDRRFASLNDTLQGTPAQVTQVRGRSSRADSLAAPTGPAMSSGNNSQQMLPPHTTSGRPTEPQRVSSHRSTRAPIQDHSAYDQRSDQPSMSRDAARIAPRSGPNSRDPSRDSLGRDDRRGDHRGPPDTDPRSRPAREGYREFSDPRAGDPRGGDPRGSDSRGSDPRGSDPRGGDPRGSDSRGSDPRGSDPRGGDPRGSDPRGGYGRDQDQYARGPPAPSYGSDPRYPPSQDPYGGSRRTIADPRGPSVPSKADHRNDNRGGYGVQQSARSDARDPGWDRRDDGRDMRKRRADEMAPDPTKRQRGGP